ncbi:MAG TPA: MFS transporter [Bacteroidales bacterium]|nr:MFS transporter [Bacteroidales bacterium]HRT90638.1 MFS transporter [Bacteroidales bacterium]
MSGTSDSSGKSSQPYIVTTAFLAMMAIVGFALYGLPFFYDQWIDEFHWSRVTVTSGNAFSKLLVAPLFGFIAGWIIDKYGPRRVMLAGILMAGGALIGLGLMSSLWMFYFFYFFNALGYIFGGPLPCQVLISRWFGKNRGKAMGIAYIGIGTGGFIVFQIAAYLITNLGWRTALTCIGIVMILISFPFAFFIREPGKSAVTETKEKTSVPVKDVLKNPHFYLLALGSMCSIAAVGGTNQHLKLYLRDLQFSQVQAANVSSLVLFSSIAGRLLVGWLADLFPRKNVMIFVYLVVASAIPLLLVPDFPGRIYLFAVIFGIGLGGDYMIIPLMAGDLFGVKVLGRVMGIVLVADGIAESLSPMMVGALYNKLADGYALGFSVLICIALTGAFFVSFLPKNKKEYYTE